MVQLLPDHFSWQIIETHEVLIKLVGLELNGQFVVVCAMASTVDFISLGMEVSQCSNLVL